MLKPATGASMMRHARLFGRALDAELPSLSPGAVKAGEMLRRFLSDFHRPILFVHSTSRSDALRTLDEFSRLRRGG